MKKKNALLDHVDLIGRLSRGTTYSLWKFHLGSCTAQKAIHYRDRGRTLNLLNIAGSCSKAIFKDKDKHFFSPN